MIETPEPTQRAIDIVVLCPQAVADQYCAPLAAAHRMSTTESPDVAVEYLTRTQAPLLIVDGDLQVSCDLCRRSRDLAVAKPAVLVTLSEPAAAGQVIDLCDSILLKPFAPNLLSSRVGRMLRDAVGTFIEWPNDPCPHCQHNGGVVLFDYASLQRAWYACRQCRTVWMARLPESLI